MCQCVKLCHLLIYAGLNSSESIVVPRRREDVGGRGGAAAAAKGAKEAFAYDNWACDMMSEEEEGVEAMASFTDDKMKEESGDEQEEEEEGMDEDEDRPERMTSVDSDGSMGYMNKKQ